MLVDSLQLLLVADRFMGKGLFSIGDYEQWKPRRRMYDPAFKSRSGCCVPSVCQ